MSKFEKIRTTSENVKFTIGPHRLTLRIHERYKSDDVRVIESIINRIIDDLGPIDRNYHGFFRPDSTVSRFINLFNKSLNYRVSYTYFEGTLTKIEDIRPDLENIVDIIND